MIGIPVLVAMTELAPIRGARDYAYRYELATEIATATDDAREREVLVRLAWFESGFRRNVARCEIKGDNGRSLGAFQVQPMSARDAKLACGELAGQVELALRYVRRSAEQCPDNTGAAKLNLYVSGRCFAKAKAGLTAAKLRWGAP